MKRNVSEKSHSRRWLWPALAGAGLAIGGAAFYALKTPSITAPIAPAPIVEKTPQEQTPVREIGADTMPAPADFEGEQGLSYEEIEARREIFTGSADQRRDAARQERQARREAHRAERRQKEEVRRAERAARREARAQFMAKFPDPNRSAEPPFDPPQMEKPLIFQEREEIPEGIDPDSYEIRPADSSEEEPAR